jgi:hypothetical protein
MLARRQASLARLAALGALGVAGGAAAVYALLVWAFSPTPQPGHPGSGGGIDRVSWYALVVAIMVPLGLAAAWHVHFARQLRGGPKPIEE